MADVHTPEVRSYNMSQIKGKNTKPEELVRKPCLPRGFGIERMLRIYQGNPI